MTAEGKEKRRQRCLDWLEKHSAAGWGVVVAARGVEAGGATLAEARREAVRQDHPRAPVDVCWPGDVGLALKACLRAWQTLLPGEFRRGGARPGSDPGPS